MKKYIVIIDDRQYVVHSTASEWFVLNSTTANIPNKKTWKIYLDGHC